MDPSRPYASVSVLYMPIRAMTPDTKQLLDEVERYYQNRGLCYLPQPSASADNTDTRV